MKYTNQSKKGGNVMKKILSVLMSFCTLFFMPIGKVNAEDTINMLIVCKTRDVFEEFSDYISKYEYVAKYQKANESSKGYPSVRSGILEYRVVLDSLVVDELKSLKKDERYNTIVSKLENACQAVILYDISDSSLDELIENVSKINTESWEEIFNYRTFLNYCIRTFMSSDIKPLWFNALNFFTYDSTKLLDENEYKKRANKIEIYTGNLEHKLNLPNIWGRGHANYLKCKNAFFGSLFGDLAEFNSFKSQKRQKQFDEQQKQFDEQQMRFYEKQQNTFDEKIDALNQMNEAEFERNEAEKKNYQMVAYQPQIQEEQVQITTPTTEEFPVQEVQPNRQQNQNDPAFLKFLRTIKDYIASLLQ